MMGYCNPEMDRLLDAIEVELDRERRKELWSALQHLYAETLPEADSEGIQRGHRARAGGELSAREHAYPRGAAQALGRQDVARSASRVVLVHD